MRRSGRTSAGRGQGSDLTESIRRQQLDDLMDDYVSWREACGVVSASYINWKRAGREEQRLAFGEYIAALNCEEEAATVYQRSVERIAAISTGATRAPGESL